jgi:hypothetical protein
LLFELGLLVLELAVIDDLAHRRIHLPGDLDEVEPERLGLGKRLAGAHDSKLLSVGHDDADFGGTNSVVDPRHVAVTTPVLVSLWLSDGFVLRWVDATPGSVRGQGRGKSGRRVS